MSEQVTPEVKSSGPAQRPSLGRIVLVPMDQSNNGGANVAPAVIVRVWSDDTVNLRVFSNTVTATEMLRTSATLVEELPETYTDPRTQVQNNVWCWPPRV